MHFFPFSDLFASPVSLYSSFLFIKISKANQRKKPVGFKVSLQILEYIYFLNKKACRLQHYAIYNHFPQPFKFIIYFK